MWEMIEEKGEQGRRREGREEQKTKWEGGIRRRWGKWKGDDREEGSDDLREVEELIEKREGRRRRG